MKVEFDGKRAVNPTVLNLIWTESRWRAHKNRSRADCVRNPRL